MRRNHAKGAAKVLGVLLVGLLPVGPASIGGGAERLDSCELEARKAYWQALKFCQLAAEPNPRLRCYEAAKAVYRTTLEDCRKAGGGKGDGRDQLSPNDLPVPSAPWQ